MTRVRPRTAGFVLDPWLICAALLAVLPALALLRPGLPHTADGQVHLLRTFEVTQLLRSGVLYPRWAPDFYLGYGYPFFNFYAPGAHLIAGALALAGLGVTGGVTALQIIALVLYPVGAYLAAREVLPDSSAAGPAALVTAALYLLAPLRFRELFVQGNLSQWLALGVLPWCAWLVARVARRGGLLRAAMAGILLAALLYAHHPSAFLAWPQLLVYGAIIVLLSPRSVPSTGADSRRARFFLLVMAFGLAVALGAPFWLPSIVELRDANLNAIAAGSFSAGLNLLPLSELMALPAVQDLGALNPPMPNSLGIAQAVLAAFGSLVALAWAAGRVPGDQPSLSPARGTGWSFRQAGVLLLAVAALLLACLVLMLPPAAPAWNALPLARFIAFPWRLLGPALLWAGLLGGAAIYWLPGRLRSPALAIALALILLGVAPYLFPRPFGAARVPSPAEVARYELGGGALGTASANEYLPRWVEDGSPPRDMAQQMLEGQQPARLDRSSLPGGSQATVLEAGPLGDSFRLDLPSNTNVRLRRFYFPGWQAWIDGQAVAVTPDGPYGLIGVIVPAGQHELRVAWGTTLARRLAGILALLGVIAILIAAIVALRQQREEGRLDEDSHVDAVWKPVATSGAVGQRDRARGDGLLQPALAGGTILMLAVVTYGFVEPQTSWFRRQSPSDRPAGMQHAVYARFANGIELLGYDLLQPETKQGGTLAVRLYWRTWREGATNARPLLHLDALNEDLTWANQTKLNAGDKPMRAWPSGFFVVDDYRIPIPADAPPVVVRLRAGLLDPQGGLVPLEGGEDLALLGRAWIQERTPTPAAALPNHEQLYQFGPDVQLAGYQVQPQPDGQALGVTLYWQATAPVGEDYTVFVHVLDATGQVVAQQDGPPVGGRYPTSAWITGQTVADPRTLPLPKDIRPEELRVRVGLYTPANGQRVPARDTSGARLSNDEVPLQPAGN